MNSNLLGDELAATAKAGATVQMAVVDPAFLAGEEVWTLSDVASFLRIADAQLASEAEAGRLPGRNLGGEWRFLKSAIVRWLSNSEVGGVVIAADAHPGVIHKSMPKNKVTNRGLLDSIGAFADDETLLPMMEQIYIDRKKS